MQPAPPAYRSNESDHDVDSLDAAPLAGGNTNATGQTPVPSKQQMKSRHSFLALAGVLALANTCHAADKPFQLHNGDRVVFYGDSITDQRLYTTFTETFVVTRFPEMQVAFVHSGWGGDRVTGGGGGGIDQRLSRDVFAYHPTVLTIMLGMNDGSYRPFDAGIYAQYTNGYQHIADSMRQHSPATRITLIQPSPFDDVTQPPKFEGGYNQVLVRYGTYVKDLASREGLGLADLNTAVVTALEKARATDAEKAKKIIPDRVHPGPAGHLLMAAELLKAWNAPSIVSAVDINAADGSVSRQTSTSVTGLKVDGSVVWTQLDRALPMPVDLNDEVTALAVGSSDFIESLDQQPLKVTGLKPGKYRLQIDGEAVGDFTHEKLAAGINLALLKTPMTQQAREVHKLTLQHNTVHFEAWRDIQVRLERHTGTKFALAASAVLDAYNDEENALVRKQRAAAKPLPRRYELVPAN